MSLVKFFDVNRSQFEQTKAHLAVRNTPNNVGGTRKLCSCGGKAVQGFSLQLMAKLVAK
jgi:hypothetical protein